MKQKHYNKYTYLKIFRDLTAQNSISLSRQRNSNKKLSLRNFFFSINLSTRNSNSCFVCASRRTKGKMDEVFFIFFHFLSSNRKDGSNYRHRLETKLADYQLLKVSKERGKLFGRSRECVMSETKGLRGGFARPMNVFASKRGERYTLS